MPQAGIDPPRQSHATYEASDLQATTAGCKIVLSWRNVVYEFPLSKNEVIGH